MMRSPSIPKLIVLFLLFLSVSVKAQQTKGYRVNIDLKNIVDDRIKISIELPDFGSDEMLYVMPNLVPGVYSLDKYGKAIRDLEAFDAAGKSVKTKRIKKNAWRFQNAVKLEYWVDDSWDSFNFIFRAGGTNIEAGKNVMLNHTGFYGYVEGHKNLPFDLIISKPLGFYGSTVMKREDRQDTIDHFSAPNYVMMADQPIMYTKPDTASHVVGNTTVNIVVYSPNQLIHANDINKIIQPLTVATEQFLGELPVEEYQYIFYFDDHVKFPGSMLMGALEHSNSSVYCLWEQPVSPYLTQSVRSIAAHEFMHILSPLNLHSEHIADFSFHNPVMSQHLWLYEGVTEYFSMLLEVKQGLVSEYEFQQRIRRKINSASTFKPYSLTTMSKEVLGKRNLISKAKHARLYGDIYEKGALTAFLLDIRINELSGGEKDLLDVIQTLMQKYGKEKPFDDATFFDAFIEASYPELRTFFDKHVIGKEALDYMGAFSKIGWTYLPKGTRFKSFAEKTGFSFDAENDRYYVRTAGKNTLGLVKGDTLESVNGNTAIDSDHLISLIYADEMETASVKIKRLGISMLLKSEKRSKAKLKSPMIIMNHDLTPDQKSFGRTVLGQ